MEFYPVLPADASPRADADACGASAGIVAVRPGDLCRPGQDGVSALMTVPSAARRPFAIASGEKLVFCHQVTAALAVVRRGGQVRQAGRWLPGNATLGILEACPPDGEIRLCGGTTAAGHPR